MKTIDDDLVRCFRRSNHKRERFTIRLAELEDATGYSLGVVLRHLQELKEGRVLEGFYIARTRLHLVKGQHFYTFLRSHTPTTLALIPEIKW